MMALALFLSVAMGLALGALGGGGSILTVPILVYALGQTPRAAIATSLLVVGATSLAALVSHARSGHVQWRTGLVFGSVSMAGAVLGGWFAQFVPEAGLLGLFAALMAVTAVAMLRGASRAEAAPRAPNPALLALEGGVVGIVTGLVGAGGGFLVVPALVLLAGLPMRAAIGTSLLVISMKSFAGLAGHLSHAAIDWPLAGMVTAAAVLGTVLGCRLARQASPARLRQGFAWFVLAMAGFVFWREAPQALRDAVLVARWPWWLGGLAIGGFVLLLLVRGGQLLGVSTGFEDACAVPSRPAARQSWRLRFLGGIVLGGLLAALAAGTWSPGFDAGLLRTAPGWLQAPLLLVGGGLLGYGARLAGGCTSGHGIVGMAQLARSSLVATGLFMVAGAAVTFAVLRLA